MRTPYGENTRVYGFSDSAYRGELRVPPETLVAIVREGARLGWQNEREHSWRRID